jgi:hypothetical protein
MIASQRAALSCEDGRGTSRGLLAITDRRIVENQLDQLLRNGPAKHASRLAPNIRATLSPAVPESGRARLRQIDWVIFFTPGPIEK